MSTEDLQANCTEAAGTLCTMTEPHERLKQIRIARGVATAADAARRFGWDEDTYKSHENGIRGISKKAVAKYAAAYKVSRGWLFFGEGNYDNTPPLDGDSALAFKRIPLLDWGVVTNSANIADAIPSATARAGTASTENFGPLVFALRVADDSMRNLAAGSPHSFSPGDEIVFDPEKAVSPGGYVLARIIARKVTLFRQYRESGYTDRGAKIITLHPLNPNYGDETIIIGETGEIIATLVRHSHDFS